MLSALTGFVVVGATIGLGYVIGRTGLLGSSGRDVLSRLVFFVLSPVLLFVVLSRAHVPTLFSALLPVSIIATICVLLLYTIASVIFFRRSVAETIIGGLSAAQVNANNIGIPLCVYLLGSASFAAPVILFQLVVLVPVAVAVLDASLSGTRSPGRILARTARNPLLIGSVLGLVVALSGVDLPTLITEPTSFVADACVPVMLISYGMSLHGQRILTSSGRIPDILCASALKLLLMPALAWAVGVGFGLTTENLLAVVVLAALPTAQNVFNFSQRYRVGEAISREVILITTVGCVPVLLTASAVLG